MAPHRILAVAVASGRVGYVLLVGDKLKDWHVSYTAPKSSTKAAELAQKWINRLKPDVLVTEKAEEAARKGTKTKAIIAAIAPDGRTQVPSRCVCRAGTCPKTCRA